MAWMVDFGRMVHVLSIRLLNRLSSFRTQICSMLMYVSIMELTFSITYFSLFRCLNIFCQYISCYLFGGTFVKRRMLN